MKKKMVLFVFMVLIVAVVSGSLFAATPIVDWKWDDATERRYTVNSVTPGTMNLLLGSILGSTYCDPAWVTVDGRKCADFSGYSTGLTYCKNTSSWTITNYQSLTPATYTIEMVFSPQELPPFSTPVYNNDYPWCFFGLMDRTNNKVFYMIRMEGQKFKYICPDGTLTCDLAGQPSAITSAGSWIYLGISYDGANTTMEVVNMTKNASTTVTQAGFGALGDWAADANGAIAVGAEVYGTNPSYRRSVDALIDELKISSDVVAEADKLYNQPLPIVDDRSFGRYDIDNFESYASDANLATVWQDYEINNSGADVSIDTSNYFAGKKSMKYSWDSQFGDSIATAVYGNPRNWTEGGFYKVMEIAFKGMAANSTSETMFVEIKDNANHTARVNYPTSADLANLNWTIWRIPLTGFTGVDLTNITELTIGLTNGTAGTGVLYFDNIRLYPCRPTAIADINKDCKVNMSDFAEFAQSWLNADLY